MKRTRTTSYTELLPYLRLIEYCHTAKPNGQYAAPLYDSQLYQNRAVILSKIPGVVTVFELKSGDSVIDQAYLSLLDKSGSVYSRGSLPNHVSINGFSGGVYREIARRATHIIGGELRTQGVSRAGLEGLISSFGFALDPWKEALDFRYSD
jgi:hypothetical protein